jgi:hypothetical protein
VTSLLRGLISLLNLLNQASSGAAVVACVASLCWTWAASLLGSATSLRRDTRAGSLVGGGANSRWYTCTAGRWGRLQARCQHRVGMTRVALIVTSYIMKMMVMTMLLLFWLQSRCMTCV